ncbi:MAG: HEAT repeat domain-containing protein [Chitinophagaceae bacterium]|nr:HEAT repeat domain-containing protein [Chitinophagaceae bacterium]
MNKRVDFRLKKMSMPGKGWLLVLSGFVLILAGCLKKEKSVYRLDPAAGSHIVIIGNTFADRWQNYNYFEPLLYSSFPDRSLVVRNLGWSADEINRQSRPLNFGSLDEHLTKQKAQIILACYGLNEAFKGKDSLPAFKNQLTVFLQHLHQQKYDGEKTPEVILISPIAHEKLKGFLPDPAEHNKNLDLYTTAMQDVCDELKIPFIDILGSTRKLEEEKDSITINGIHLNDQGYKAVSEIIAASLGLPAAKWGSDGSLQDLKKLIDQKNKQFFYLYRAVNSEYIVGRRKEPWVQPPGGPVSYPGELAKLNTMVSRLDSVVWAEAGKSDEMNFAKANSIIKDTVQFVVPDKSKLQKPAANTLILQDGYAANLFASEVDFDISNPVKIVFDPRGRLWVADMASYPQYLPGAPTNDKILILEDTDGDGQADKQTVFADSLYMPNSFEFGNGGVYVSQPPNLWFMKDTDGDGRADLKEIVLHGFGTEDIHHTLNTFTWGPDGALYWHMGTFLHSQVETPYGPVRNDYGTTFRYEPLTQKLEPYVSYGYANPWGHVFMRNGTEIISDVSTGMNYFAPPLTVAIDYPAKHSDMKDFLTTGIKPKTCGTEIISSRHFPDEAQGNVLLNTFIGFLGVKQHRVSKDGSGIIGVETEPLLQSKDPNFRPVDLRFGPDGALYVVDWYNPIISHGERALRDPLRDHTHGRIWRITHKNKPLLKPVDFATLPVEQLLNELKVYEDRHRYTVHTQLRQLPAEKVLPALEKWVKELDANDKEVEQHRLEALWVSQQFNQTNKALLQQLLKSPDEMIRTAATRVLFYSRNQVPDAESQLIRLSTDESASVRLQAIISLSHFKTESAVKALLTAVSKPVDYYIDYVLKESFRQLQPVWTGMFKKDKDFLAGDSATADYLLGSVADTKQMEAPGFIRDDPQWRQYGRQGLSDKDYEALKDAVAVTRFLSSRQAGATETGSSSPGQPLVIPGRTVVQLSTVPAKMVFDKTTITVKAGEAITVIFENPDGMPHNVVIAKPGMLEKVGKAADAMAAQKDGYEKSFVPSVPEVLFFTPLIQPGKNFRLDFKAPQKSGEYPFVCTFPGHWQTMKGVMKVVSGK